MLCEDVRAEASGQQTLVGVITAIPAQTLPIAFFKLCLWTRWCGGEGKFRQRAVIIAPDDETKLAEFHVDFQLQEMSANATNVHVFGGLRFEQAGLHTIEVYLDDQLQLSVPLAVILVQPG